jgi:hypothetical protein
MREVKKRPAKKRMITVRTKADPEHVAENIQVFNSRLIDGRSNDYEIALVVTVINAQGLPVTALFTVFFLPPDFSNKIFTEGNGTGGVCIDGCVVVVVNPDGLAGKGLEKFCPGKCQFLPRCFHRLQGKGWRQCWPGLLTGHRNYFA